VCSLGHTVMVLPCMAVYHAVGHMACMPCWQQLGCSRCGVALPQLSATESCNIQNVNDAAALSSRLGAERDS
jgi:hypothetical protein